MANDVVIGVYLERNGGIVMRSVAYGPDNGFKAIEPTDIQEFTWDPNDSASAIDRLKDLAQVAIDLGGSDLDALSIASYGPFRSLKRSNIENNFGVIQNDHSAPPFSGVNLRDIFYKKVVDNKSNRNTRITIHTDAEACAIGEALLRETGERELLIYILCSEGIGMGVVQGRRPLSSALHSEIGLLHISCAANDLLNQLNDTQSGWDGYSLSLSEVASNQALRKRFALQAGLSEFDITDVDVRADVEGPNWELQAYYIAQACLACTVTFAPHFIVVGSDFEPGGSVRSLEARTNAQFRDILKSRSNRGQAVFSYAELDSIGGYISKPRDVPFYSGRQAFRMTGVLGISYAAANSAYGAKHGFPNTVNIRG